MTEETLSQRIWDCMGSVANIYTDQEMLLKSKEDLLRYLRASDSQLSTILGILMRYKKENNNE